MRKKTLNKKIPILIVIATLLMSVGYATINSISLDIAGNANAYKYDSLFISSISVDDENTLNGINDSNNVNGVMLNTSITLGDDLFSKLTMVVNVCNNYSNDRIFSGLRYSDLTEEELAEYPDFTNLYTNNDIIIDDTSYSNLAGTVLSSQSCMDIPVTFKYSSDLSSIVNNQLNATINFKFDTLETYNSNITYSINSTSGSFENKYSTLNYDITVTNNNTYAIKFSTYGSSNDDILLSGTTSDIIVNGNSTTTTTVTLSPAKEIYLYKDIVNIDVNVKVNYPLELSEKSYTLSISTFGSTLKELILGKTTLITSTPSFSQNVTTTAYSGLFKTVDESGDTYVYRGVVTDNYVSFANLTWRIVRINGDGTYRLVTDNSIGKSIFSSDTTSTYNVGYMYGSTVRDNTNDSAIKTYLENWYANNLDAYDEFIDRDALFSGKIEHIILRQKYMLDGKE